MFFLVIYEAFTVLEPYLEMFSYEFYDFARWSVARQNHYQIDFK